MLPEYAPNEGITAHHSASQGITAHQKTPHGITRHLTVHYKTSYSALQDITVHHNAVQHSTRHQECQKRLQGCSSGGLRPHVPAVVSRQPTLHMHPTHARATTNDCSLSAGNRPHIRQPAAGHTGKQARERENPRIQREMRRKVKSTEEGRFFKYSLKKQSNCWRYFKFPNKH